MCLVDLFDDPHSLAILRHKAISKENVCFDFTTRPEAGTSRSSSNPAQWTQNDFFFAAHSEHVEEEVAEHIPTVLDDLDDTNASPTVEVNNSVPSSLPAAVVSNHPNHVESYQAGDISLSKQPQNTDTNMDKCCHSSDDKQLPSTFQLLVQPDSSNVDNPNNSQIVLNPVVFPAW